LKTKKLVTWAIALILFALCLSAARWQLNKGIALTKKNSIITKQISYEATLDPENIDPEKDQWRKFMLTGKFSNEYKLVKNRYFEGRFGFHVLEKFDASTLGQIWIDRGWVKAGKDAKTAPAVPVASQENDLIEVRLRSEFISTHPAGTLFAMPAKKNVSQTIYFDLLDGKINKPLTSIDLPELSTGPHFAYALQWLFFGVMILFGAFLIQRSDRKAD
jgi:cytochrome oxidase assembly protein ShyY1